jgi:endonuclease/exonuclease/phosphatase family metal-dependent hydrolase
MRAHSLRRSLIVACGIVLTVALAGRLGQAGGNEGAGPAAETVVKPTNAPAAGPESKYDPNSLVVASYNMNYGISDKGALDEYVRIIRKCGADVLAVQEGNPALYAHLKTALSKDYPHMKFYPGPAACGFGWLSRKPLLNPAMLPKSAGWFGTPMVQVMVGGRTVQLVNVHLMATVPPKDANTATMLTLLAKTEAVRAKEIRFIQSKLPPRMPVVMLGDLNSISSMYAPTFLTGMGFTDSFASVTAEADSRPSWHWRQGKAAWQLRLDYIWHDRNFKTLSGRIVAEGPSDHYPVVSKLELLLQPASQPASPIACMQKASDISGIRRQEQRR